MDNMEIKELNELKRKKLLHLSDKLRAFADDEEILTFCDVCFTEERPLEWEAKEDGTCGYRFKQSGTHTLSIRISNSSNVGEYIECHQN